MDNSTNPEQHNLEENVIEIKLNNDNVELREEKPRQVININEVQEVQNTNINKEPININEVEPYQNPNDEEEIKIVLEQKKDEQEQPKENINVVDINKVNEENKNEKNSEENDLTIFNNQENITIDLAESEKNNIDTIIVLEENKNNLTNEEMAQRNNVNENNDNILNNENQEPKDNNEQNNQNVEIITKEKNIGEDFNVKDIAKITEFNKSNYKEFYIKNHFCDYNSGNEWRSGFITNISNDYVELFDSTGYSCSKSVSGIIKIKIYE